MNKKALCTALLLFVGSSASAESIFLTCELVQGSQFDMRTVYKPVPPLEELREKFFRDAFTEGIGMVFVFPPETWEINLADKTVHSPEEPRNVITDISITNSKIQGMSAWGESFELNRINGKLSYVRLVQEERRKIWESKHGGQLPHELGFEYLCTAKADTAV